MILAQNDIKTKPAIIVISSHVIRGTVGNRAAAFALEVLGYPVWIVPTVTLPWHPGQGPSKRVVPSADEFCSLIDDLTNAPWINEVGAILTGYFGNVDQVKSTVRLIDKVKSQNPRALYALDPVMGDANLGEEGQLYISEQQAHAIRELLVQRANLVTPNPFELGWLTNVNTPHTAEDLSAAALNLGTELVLGTSAPALMTGHIGNMLVDNRGAKPKAYLAEHRRAKGPPNGLGDLAAALMLGHLLGSDDAVSALEKTSSSLYEVMHIASAAQSNELILEASIGSLGKPRTAINARQLLLAAK